MKLTVAAIQMDIELGNPKENIKRASKRIEQAAENKPDVIVLPELWTTGYDLERLDVIGDANGEEIKRIMSSLARQYKVNIVAGSVAKKTDKGIFNTLYAFNRKGEMTGEYSKLHLIRLMQEEKFISPGSSKGNFMLENVPAAGVICYDIRFPEWIRAHILDGASILFVPAEWPSQRLTHWRNLLITRAIENQCYVVGCNRVGSDKNNTFAGHTMVIDPWGEIVAEAGGEEETILYAEISTDLVEEVRTRIPVFEDRRPEFY
ncbi:carbon-nitrogen family hydrolase [Fictibacillus terranigra]|uniref:Carbon-nitrogen family hydrolase n=1 Tax=Fictibacillus terranigra TaxID=3058424 RepID=A0ABT8E763_9BACL|nr:carbon-nitrogen family hydrolase [Fictibacillus sp. CENA-BCM004]MDN4073754.1 carbon-nitrogen family hydrolase [Fictibacillus sp. CENA-BCM004]